MDREELTAQVKAEYQRLASGESRINGGPSTDGMAPDAYYEALLGMVTAEISAGTFDSFGSGGEIVGAVANQKRKWLGKWEREQ